ncbi:MAG: hypothetical protein O7E57_02325 [Gammaproteobacteria bacterium]|nr:hypothetical protein [Gammaproteobacteria bacterium]
MMKLSDINVGDELPLREHTASNVSLFLYNAAVWNAHRIHYDEAYTTGVEQHPQIVIDGPLQGDWLSQCALNWVGDAARLTNFSYSNRKAAYLGETLTTGGRVTAVDVENDSVSVELFVSNAKGEVTTPGTAVLRFD